MDFAPSSRRKGKVVEHTSLSGRIVLFVEDEPLIVLSIGAASEKVGAVLLDGAMSA